MTGRPNLAPLLESFFIQRLIRISASNSSVKPDRWPAESGSTRGRPRAVGQLHARTLCT
jgi:hypothetical protein